MMLTSKDEYWDITYSHAVGKIKGKIIVTGFIAFMIAVWVDKVNDSRRL